MSEIDFRDWAALVPLACSRLFSTLTPFLVFATLYVVRPSAVQCSPQSGVGLYVV